MQAHMITSEVIFLLEIEQNWLYLFIPLPDLPQVINVEFWLHIFFPVESYEWNLANKKRLFLKP